MFVYMQNKAGGLACLYFKYISPAIALSLEVALRPFL